MSNNQENSKGCKLHVFERNNYFYGKLMTVRDFETEQSYMNEKRHFLNRLIHGSGLVCGLRKISFEVNGENDPIKIKFEEGGVALDCFGREIVVEGESIEVNKEEELPEGTDVTIERTKSKLTLKDIPEYPYLFLKCKDCKTEMVNAASNPSSCDETCCPNRIREEFEVIASAEGPKIDPIVCPQSLSEAENAQKVLEKIGEWIQRRGVDENNVELPPCPECTDPKVFLAVIRRVGPEESEVEVNLDDTKTYRSFVYNNKLLAELLACHMSDFDNPHKSLNGLKAEGVVVEKDEDGYITIEKDNAITIDATEEHKITIGETHSEKEGNPHETNHIDLLNVEGAKSKHPQGDARNKHVSNGDVKRWDSAIYTLNEKPPESGNFDVKGTGDVKVTTKKGEITISSKGGGGAECVTGVVVLRKSKREGARFQML